MASLIIFMITAPLINPGEIELPSVQQRLSAPKDALEITIKKDQSLTLRDTGRDARSMTVSQDELIQRVRESASGRC